MSPEFGGHDITRFWRLKGARIEFLASHRPVTDEVILPQSSLSSHPNHEIYVFEKPVPKPEIIEKDVPLAKAAR